MVVCRMEIVPDSDRSGTASIGKSVNAIGSSPDTALTTPTAVKKIAPRIAFVDTIGVLQCEVEGCVVAE
jgi:hypothetical protein